MQLFALPSHSQALRHVEGLLHELQGEVGRGMRTDGEHEGADRAADEADGTGDGEARQERVAAPAARASAGRRGWRAAATFCYRCNRRGL